MASKTKSMSTVKQILRFHLQGKSGRFISRTIGISRNTIQRYLGIASNLPLGIDELLLLEDVELDSILTVVKPISSKDKSVILMDMMSYFESELKKVGVHRYLLWQEYLLKHPDGYSYTQFCDYFQKYRRTKSHSMVVNHQAGDVLYVDFAGKTMSYFDKNSGEEIKCQVFVAVLGYSQYAYVQAVESQKVQDFVSALNSCLRYIGGVPAAIVPDNLKSAVIKSDRYEPQINCVLEDWANHNQTTIIPARSGKPKDKALVENMVKISYSRIYAPLREKIFTSLADLNEAILEQLSLHNGQHFQKKPFSRNDVFLNEEKSLLKVLPNEVFKIKKYKTHTVQKNCHITLSEDNHHYSVPQAYIGQKVEVVYTSNMVSIYCHHNLIAQHLRTHQKHAYTSVSEHLPSSYGYYKDRCPDYYRKQAQKYGVEFESIISGVLHKKTHPEQAYKSCDGLLSLARKTDTILFTKACKLAQDAQKCNYRFMLEILNNGMAEHYQTQCDTESEAIVNHENIRGNIYK